MPKLIRTVLDWETAFGHHPVTGENITLKMITTEHYVRHPQFKAHGLGVKIDKDPAFYLYKRDDLLYFLKNHPWGRTLAIAHHSHFDGAILGWRCGIQPAFWGDTLSMARAIFPHEPNSLERTAEILGVPPKGKELGSVKDLWVLTDEQQKVLGDYCINDCEITSQVFDKLVKHFPVSELRLIDWTTRCFTEPSIDVDQAPLLRSFIKEKRTKRALIKRCGVDKKALGSASTFPKLLMGLDVDPPKKMSPSKIKDGRIDPDEITEDAPEGILPTFKIWKGITDQERIDLKAQKNAYPWTYAFGKDDELFKRLLNHPDQRVKNLVEARMGIKSTIKETRTKRFYKIGGRGKFPVYLNYYGAHTNRWSGGDKQNAQNLNRVDADDPHAGALRMSLIAPPGHLVVVRDLSQIEARMLVYWAGQEDMLDMFRAGGDPYDFMATKIYGRPVSRKTVPGDAKAGQVGKLVVLGAGYQMGWASMQEQTRVGFMGMPGIIFDQSYTDQLNVNIDAFAGQRSYKKGCANLEEQALACKPLDISEADHLRHCAVTKHLIDSFRGSNPRVVALWRECQSSLAAMLLKNSVQVGARPLVTTSPEGFVLPNGMKIRYSELRKSSEGKEFKYLADARKHEWTKIYAGKATENGVQALSRIVLSDQILRVEPRLKAFDLRPGEISRIVTSTHDEMVAIVPERYAQKAFDLMGLEMAAPPEWCSDLPLKSAGGYAKSYGDCEH